MSPNYRPRDINWALVVILTKIEIPRDGKYSSRASILGSQDPNDSGPERPVVATVGNWRSIASKCYVYLGDEISTDAAKVFVRV